MPATVHPTMRATAHVKTGGGDGQGQQGREEGRREARVLTPGAVRAESECMATRNDAPVRPEAPLGDDECPCAACAADARAVRLVAGAFGFDRVAADLQRGEAFDPAFAAAFRDAAAELAERIDADAAAQLGRPLIRGEAV
jgi:hypothetical protein